MSTSLDELRKEADDLGITYGKTLGEAKLAEKIDAFYKAQETPGPEVIEEEEVKEEEEEVVKAPQKVKMSEKDKRNKRRMDREAAARELKIVTIVDNDQRVNNQTTTCVASCSNEYFDLGTLRLPLNERIEVAVGHIRTLQAIQIPLHVRNTKTGLSTVRMRPRYSISFG